MFLPASLCWLWQVPQSWIWPRSAPGDLSAHPLGTALGSPSVVGLKDPLSHKQPSSEKKHRRCSKSSWQTSECRAGMASQVSGMQKGTRAVSPLQSFACSIKNTSSIENFWSDKCASASFSHLSSL